MAKKTWIKLKRGLLEPKHRDQLGPAVWLYLYILDRADWEQGAVLDWKDKDAADELQLGLKTLRNYRRRLEDNCYIRTTQKQYGQVLTINNWTNPREYSGKTYNQGGKDGEPQEYEGGYQGSPQGSHQGMHEQGTPTSNSHNTNHNTDRKDTRKRDPLLDHPAILGFRKITHRHVPIAWRSKVAEAVNGNHEDFLALVEEWIGYGWNPTNVKGMLEAFKSGGIKSKGKPARESAKDRFERRQEMLNGN